MRSGEGAASAYIKTATVYQPVPGVTSRHPRQHADPERVREAPSTHMSSENFETHGMSIEIDLNRKRLVACVLLLKLFLSQFTHSVILTRAHLHSRDSALWEREGFLSESGKKSDWRNRKNLFQVSVA